MGILEVAAVSQDMRSWAKAVPERKKQSKHLQACLHDPEDDTKFFAAIAKSIKEDGKNEARQKPVKKRSIEHCKLHMPKIHTSFLLLDFPGGKRAMSTKAMHYSTFVSTYSSCWESSICTGGG